MNRNNRKGFTLVEIMIVVVIIGLLAAMAIPAFQKVRQTSQTKTITNNLRQLAAAAQQYMLDTGAVSVAYTDVVGTGKYITSDPKSVAGETYSSVFPIATNTENITITTSATGAVQYNF